MAFGFALALALAPAGCGRVGFDARPATDAAGDGSDDASCTLGDFTLVGRLPGPVTSGFDEWSGMTFLADTHIMFHRYMTGGDLYVASRASAAEPFANVVAVGELNDAVENEWTPALTEDGLVIVFSRTVGGANFGLMTSTRASATEPWPAPIPMPELDSTANEYSPWLSADGLRITFASSRSGEDLLYESTRPDRSAPFAQPALLDVRPGMDARDPTLSPDGLELFFAAGQEGVLDVYTARRPALDQPFGPAALVPQLSSPRDDVALRFSRDGKTLYLNHDTLVMGGGAADIWYATRDCL